MRRHLGQARQGVRYCTTALPGCTQTLYFVNSIIPDSSSIVNALLAQPVPALDRPGWLGYNRLYRT